MRKQKETCDYLLFDVTNVLYRTFFANKDEDDTTSAGLAHHLALVTLNKYYKAFNPKKVVMAFDRSNWRKAYTQDTDTCITTKIYKGQRRQQMSPSQQAKFEAFVDHIAEFESIMREHTSIICLGADWLEADDLLAGFTQVFNSDDIVIITQDKDYVQLLKNPNIRIYDPATGKPRTLEDWGGDADYFMFEKCMRGDLSDNVQSAYPRIRSTKLKQAYADPYVLTNILEHVWTDAHGTEFLVKDLFEENQMLMDLAKQPECVRRKIFNTILDAMDSPGSFSYFHFMKYLGKYEMKKLAEQLDNFLKLLSS